MIPKRHSPATTRRLSWTTSSPPGDRGPLIGALCAGQGAIAEDWPTQPVRIVLPYPPGGASDVTARLLGQKMGRPDTSVVIENRPGANGIIANEAVAKSPADGYTILMANLGPNAINPAVYAKLPYDTTRTSRPSFSPRSFRC